MTPDVLIRPERPSDHRPLRELIAAAFEGKPYAAGDEPELLAALREAGALTVSLVAERDGEVVGQAAFSPARPSDGSEGWYAIGPVAVLPSHQGRGIGAMLVRAGLESLAVRGAAGCICVGDPRYYARFGFHLSPGNAPPDQPADHFMVAMLRGPRPEGPISFHPAFGGTA